MTTSRIHLQGIGDLPGTPAGQIIPGDRLMWNYGITTEVVSVRDASAKFIEVTEKSDCTGTVTTRRLRKDRLVAK